MNKREAIKMILDLVSETDADGDVWGFDTNIGNIEELVDVGMEILRKAENERKSK